MKFLKSWSVVGLFGVLSLTVGCSAPKNENMVSPVDGSIIGGKAVEKSDVIATSTVALIGVIYDKDGQMYQYTCTGSLIRKNVVLTAGHCLPAVPKGGQGGLLVVFTQDLNTATEKDVRYVVDAALHPDYALGDEEATAEEKSDEKTEVASGGQNDQADSEPVNGNDLALVLFQGELPAGYKSAVVLTDESLLQEGTAVTLAGYGLTDGVKKTSDSKLNKVQVEVAGHYGNEVVLDQSNGRGACHGDSGGPAFVEIKGVQYLWGVTSRGIGKDGKDDCSLLSVYGKVYSQKDFISWGLKKMGIK